MKRFVLIVLSVFICLHYGFSQENKKSEDNRILIRGMVIDATTLAPITNSQILINNTFSAVSGADGSFSFYVNRNDTVEFRSLGYKQTIMPVSDTLLGMEYLTGIYLNTDTLAIPEVIILPGYSNLKSEIMNARSETPTVIENARYNVAVSAYQGKNSQNVLGSAQNNYAMISQRQKINAFEKGGISSEHIVGFNPLIFLPAAYVLLHGLPESPPPYKPQLTDQEIDKVNQKYLETHYERK